MVVVNRGGVLNWRHRRVLAHLDLTFHWWRWCFYVIHWELGKDAKMELGFG